MSRRGHAWPTGPTCQHGKVVPECWPCFARLVHARFGAGCPHGKRPMDCPACVLEVLGTVFGEDWERASYTFGAHCMLTVARTIQGAQSQPSRVQEAVPHVSEGAGPDRSPHWWEDLPERLEEALGQNSFSWQPPQRPMAGFCPRCGSPNTIFAEPRYADSAPYLVHDAKDGLCCWCDHHWRPGEGPTARI
jgi:hypothetical protein